jgi:hypothetical protein
MAGGLTRQAMEKGRGMMPRLRSRRLLVLLLILSIALVLDVGPVASQESLQIAGKIALIRKDHIRFCVDKEEGHYLCLYAFEGTNHSTGKDTFMHHAYVTHCIFADAVERNGPIQGYTTMSGQEGTALLKWNGQWTTTRSADGSSVSVFEGLFRIVKGTGRYARIQGTGTFKGRMTTPIVQVEEWEGECSIEK